MKITFNKPRLRSKGGYNHIYLLSISWGRDGLLITALNAGVMIMWGNSIKPQSTKED